MTFSRQAGRSRVLPRDKNHERKGRSGGREKLERDGTPRDEQNLIACEQMSGRYKQMRERFYEPAAVLRDRGVGAKLLAIYGDSLSPSFLLASVE